MQKNKATDALISSKKREGEKKPRISSVTEQTVALAWIKVLSGCRFLIPTERWK